jgi:protoheme IX farnesyltransferase
MSAPAVESVAHSQPRSFVAVAKDFISLMKPGLSGLVLFTTAGGMWMSGRLMPWWAWAWALIGTAGTVGAANAFNCVIERDSDRFMPRTSVRPLPAGRMEATPALVFALVLAAFSLPVLTAGTNLLTGALGAVALLSYVLVYTPLKRRTHWAMQVGAFPGALPPLMGWTAATNSIDTPGLVLFGILFFWQLPHFIAIALFRKNEYRSAGLTSLPLQKGDAVARWHAVAYLVALSVCSVLPVVVGMSGKVYLVIALGLNALFLGEGVRGVVTKGEAAWARKLFGVSLLYLTVLFVGLAVDSAFR